ncbi:MAG: dTDP-4-dehydrorhamnose 3,5-epimerase family protein [Candidatus Acidiferrum sp.]
MHGVIWRKLTHFHDSRGWLCEMFRHDELPSEYHPVMAYISMTEPGIARGPHEHIEQADCFCFLGPSDFKVYLWDRRADSSTYLSKDVRTVGISKPTLLIVPAGVVHAYKNVGSEQGIVFNCPNRLYRGPGRKAPVDEIRHEDVVDSPYQLD